MTIMTEGNENENKQLLTNRCKPASGHVRVMNIVCERKCYVYIKEFMNVNSIDVS